MNPCHFRYCEGFRTSRRAALDESKCRTSPVLAISTDENDAANSSASMQKALNLSADPLPLREQRRVHQ